MLTRLMVTRIVLGLALSVVVPATLAATAPVGATPGSFAVNQNGGATYTIPITAPPGTAGMVPNLTLTYDKQVQNDLLGVGWSVSGLSLIQRCGRTIALDGLKGGVNYDNNDRFCLDGQRLIAINNGVDGANGTEYRTEKESFSKIISYRDPPVVLFYVFGAPIYDPSTIGMGPQNFRVTTKSGTVMEYGVTADARIEVQGSLGTARLWALNKIQDTKGNYLTISYSEDNANGEYHPTRIAYTGNSGAVVAPYNSICFIYDNDPATTPACDAPATTTRPDIVPRYEGGAVIKTTRRLSHIQTYAGAILARSYRLSYDNNGAVGASRLTSITECGSDGVCLPGVAIEIQSGAASIFNASGVISPVTTDICANGSTAYGQCNDGDNFSTINFVDVNGDGMADLVYRGDTGIQVWLSTGTGFTPGWSSDICANGSTAYGSCNDGDNFSNIYYPDINGDGRADLCYRSDTGIKCFLSTGSGWGTFISTDICANGSTAYGQCNDGDNFSTINFADVNGDGKADLVYRGDTGIQVWLSTGTGFTPGWSSDVCANGSTAYGQCNDGDNFSNIYYPDINGDGRADLCYRSDTGIKCFLSTGSGWGTFISTDICANGSTAYGQCNDG